MERLIKNTCILLFLLTSYPVLAQSAWKDSMIVYLDRIRSDDQFYRIQLDSVQARYGGRSPELQNLLKQMHAIDSVNTLKITTIIDRYGWLGPDSIGVNGNRTLFLVIQHAEDSVQEKYLPVMREAVKAGRAKAGSLALLEDRVSLQQGKKQIYGSQVSWNMETNEYYVLPLEDPDHVDERRAKVGLPPMAVYLAEWDMKWDVEQYKKDLPRLEKEMK